MSRQAVPKRKLKVADLRSIYEQGMSNVTDIDEKLDSLTDQETAGLKESAQ